MAHSPFTREEVQTMITLYQQGKTQKEIASLLHCSPNSVSKHLTDNGVATRRRGCVPTTYICAGCSENFEGLSHYKAEIPLCLICAPDKSWRARYFKYGITKPQFDAMVQQQHGNCDLCEMPLPDRVTDIFIDHCHTQGHPRGCPQCWQKKRLQDYFGKKK